MFKNVLVVSDTHTGFPTSLSPALNLASASAGQLTVCQVIIQEVAPVAATATATPIAIAPALYIDENRMKKLRTKSAHLRSEIEQYADNANVSINWHQEEGGIDLVAANTAALARVHDVSVLSGPESRDGLEWMVFLEKMVCESGRPCLIVPHAYSCETLGNCVQISWDGSVSAARAVHDSLPLLREADSVFIVGKGDVAGQEICSGEKLHMHLQRHGVNTTVHKLSSNDGNDAETLVDHAEIEGRDLLVMGAYNQSWLRRFILGSVTDKTIQDLRIPVFVAH